MRSRYGPRRRLRTAAAFDAVFKRGVRLSGRLFLLGTMLFSGSLYALAVTGNAKLGMVTPLGGVAFLAGWLALAAAFARRA